MPRFASASTSSGRVAGRLGDQAGLVAGHPGAAVVDIRPHLDDRGRSSGPAVQPRTSQAACASGSITTRRTGRASPGVDAAGLLLVEADAPEARARADPVARADGGDEGGDLGGGEGDRGRGAGGAHGASFGWGEVERVQGASNDDGAAVGAGVAGGVEPSVGVQAHELHVAGVVDRDRRSATTAVRARARPPRPHASPARRPASCTSWPRSRAPMTKRGRPSAAAGSAAGSSRSRTSCERIQGWALPPWQPSPSDEFVGLGDHRQQCVRRPQAGPPQPGCAGSVLNAEPRLCSRRPCRGRGCRSRTAGRRSGSGSRRCRRCLRR